MTPYTYFADKRAIFDPEGNRIGTGRTNALAAEIVSALNFAEHGQRLAMTPGSVIEHFDGEQAGTELSEVDDAKLTEACWGIVDHEGIYRAWHDACVEVYEDVTGNTYPPDEPDA